jgi:site-specific DNA recombinase
LIYKNGINLYVNNQKYDFDNKMDRLLFGVLSIVNEFENHQRFEKGLMGKIKILEDDKHWGGTIPFGYDKDKDGRLIPHKFTSKMLKMIFQQYVKGKSINKIGNKLEELNVWTQRGNKKWNDNSIRLILKNELYYLGKMKFEVKTLKGKSKEYCREKGLLVEKIINCPPLVDKETFDKVQSMMSKNRKSSKRPIENKVLLRGLIRCGNCGSTYYGRINEKQNINTYICQSSTKKFRDSTIQCDNKRSINIRLTDDLIWTTILDVFQNSETIKKQFREENIPKELNDPKILKQKISNIQSKIDRRRNKTVELEERRTELYENYLSLKINKDTLDRLMESSNQSNLEVLEEIKQLESEILILKGGIEWEEWFEDFEVYISKIKSYTSLEQKRKFIESIIENITVSWDNVTNTHNLKIKFRLHIVKDKGKLIGNEISDIKKGKKTLILNELDFKKGWMGYRKFLNQKTSYINHSTVRE